MQFTSQRKDLLFALQRIIGVVERKQTMPILSCVRIEASSAGLTLTATDLELELVIHCAAQVEVPGVTAVPAKKLLDICRGLPADAQVKVDIDGEHVRVRSGHARFLLSQLSGSDWPEIKEFESDAQLELAESVFKQLIDKTEFAMANQDVRYYLNGMLLVLRPDLVRCVTTDGHRLAMSEQPMELPLEQAVQAIVPRKAIQELAKVLTADEDKTLSLRLSKNHMRLQLANLTFTTKLIDGRFPDYERVIPVGNDKRVQANCEQVKQALTRTAILSSEKFGGVRLTFDAGQLTVQAQNTDKEQAEDQIAIDYDQPSLTIGFNVHYLLDVLGAMTAEEFTFDLADEGHSGLIKALGDDSTQYVVMPMRL